jgi:hypothetical protein
MIIIFDSQAGHDFFPKGILTFQQVGVKIGPLGFETAALAHRTAVRGEGIECGTRRGRLQSLDGSPERGTFIILVFSFIL